MVTTTKEKGRDSCKSATPTTSAHDTALTLHPVKGEPCIDSRLLALYLGPGRPEKYAMLNEDHAYLLLTYSRNTAKVRALKVRLVKAFREARQAPDVTHTEYLPTYHALHDEIRAPVGQSPNERFVHMNVNRLINKAVGIGPGQRGRLGVPRRSILIAPLYVASTAKHGAVDHREGYAHAKYALDRFGVTLLGDGHAR